MSEFGPINPLNSGRRETVTRNSVEETCYAVTDPTHTAMARRAPADEKLSSPEAERLAAFLQAPPYEWLLERVLPFDRSILGVSSDGVGFVSGVNTEEPGHERAAYEERQEQASEKEAKAVDPKLARGWLFSEEHLGVFVRGYHDPDFPDRYEGLRRLHGIAHLGQPFLELRREGEALDLLFLPSEYLGIVLPTFDVARESVEVAFAGDKGASLTGRTYADLAQFAERLPLTISRLWTQATVAADALRELFDPGHADPEYFDLSETRLTRLRDDARNAAERLIGAATRFEAALDLLEDFEAGTRCNVTRDNRWLHTVGIVLQEFGPAPPQTQGMVRLIKLIRLIREQRPPSARSAMIALAKAEDWRSEARGVPNSPYDKLTEAQRERWEAAAYQAFNVSITEALVGIQHQYGMLLRPGDLVKQKTDLETLLRVLERT